MLAIYILKRVYLYTKTQFLICFDIRSLDLKTLFCRFI